MTASTITIDGIAYVRADSIDRAPSELKIVVLQRGWVVVGRVRRDGTEVIIDDASVVRRWGTTSGLGQLAASGPQESTVLDPAGRVTAHELAVVLMIDCDEQAWS